MRIIAGECRGREIVSAKGTTTRPTSDRVREALFSSLTSLMGTWEGVRVLDPFAGSGALGLEALSRGAESAVFVEQDRKALDALRANIERCGLAGRSTVAAGDAFRVLDRRGLAHRVSLLLLDPPYRIDKAKVRGLVETLVERGALAEGAVVVWEHASADDVSLPDGLRLHASRIYGSTAIDIAIVAHEEEDR